MSASIGALAAVALVAYVIYIVVAAPDYTPGKPEVRFTVAAGCPHRLAKFGDVRPRGAGLGDALAPSESARAGLICTYRPGHRVTGRLVVADRLARPDARALGAALAEVDLKSVSETSCPNDTGRFAVIVLAYPDRPDVDVEYDDSGCQWLDNGIVGAEEVANPSFYNRFASTFERLLHAG